MGITLISWKNRPLHLSKGVFPVTVKKVISLDDNNDIEQSRIRCVAGIDVEIAVEKLLTTYKFWQVTFMKITFGLR